MSGEVDPVAAEYKAIADFDASYAPEVGLGSAPETTDATDPLASTVRYCATFVIVNETGSLLEHDDHSRRVIAHPTYDAALRAGVATGVSAFEVRKMYVRDQKAWDGLYITARQAEENRRAATKPAARFSPPTSILPHLPGTPNFHRGRVGEVGLFPGNVV